MRSSRSSWAAALLLVLAAPAGAQGFTPRTDYERLMQRPKPSPQIPADFRVIVSAASPDSLIVRGLDGGEIPLDVEWYEPSDYLLYQNGRFLGMSLQGYEAYGYYLIDRAGSGQAAVLETGEAPSFSPDGRFIAAAEMSDAGWGNLEGVSVGGASRADGAPLLH